MNRKIDRVKSTIYARLLGMERLHGVYDRMAAYGLSKRAGRKVRLSYMGALDLGQDYRRFHLSAACDISAMILPTPAHLIVMHHFEHRFHFSHTSDESSLSVLHASQVADAVIELLSSCLCDETRPPGR